MSSGLEKVFLLHVKNLSELAWSETVLHRKPPNLYVEIKLGGSVQRTQVIHRSLTPTWDCGLSLSGTESSTLSLLVKHNTSAAFLWDSYVGGIDIELSELLRLCENLQFTTLKLRSKEKKPEHSVSGLITVRLSAGDTAQAAEIVVSGIHKDIEHGGIGKSSTAGNYGPKAVDVAVKVMDSVPTIPEILGNVVSKLDVFVTIVDKVSKVHPYANFAWQVISSLYKAFKGQIERDQNLLGLVMAMEDVCVFVDIIKSVPNKLHHLENTINNILKQIVECSIFIREYTGHGFATRLVGQTFSSAGQTINEMANHLIALQKSLDSGMSLQTVFVSSRTFDGVEKLVRTESLKRLNSVEMNASSRPECLPDTRQDVLKSIADLLTTPSSEQNIIWLHGLAGSGKSTISTTIAEYFRGLNRLGAFLFFNRNNPSCSEQAVFVPTLCEQLASFNSIIGKAVCAQIDQEQSITKATMRVQFAKLLLEPLGTLTELHTAGPIIVVVDALDECGNPATRKDLLGLIAEEFAKFPPNFRFLITSRREPDIESALSRRSHVVMRELDIMNEATASDISAYLRHYLSRLKDNPLFELASDWPGEDNIQALTKSSAGLFIWVSTAVKFMEEGYHPDQQLRLLLQDHPKEAEAALDQLYVTALSGVGNWDKAEVVEVMRAVLGAIIVGRELLSDTSLDHLLGLGGFQASRFTLARLRCLIQWNQGQPAKVLHASFADYLTDACRSGDRPWFINPSVHHQNLASGCFRIMKHELKFNICNLETSHLLNKDVTNLDSRIKHHISTHLSYSCCFWADHLQETVLTEKNLLGVKFFLSHQFLFWLEVLSLVGQVCLATPALVTSSNWAAHDEETGLWVQDMVHFVSTFRYPIFESAPHIYVSAVPFSPLNSWVSSQYGAHISHCLSVPVGRLSDWPSDRYFLDGHQGTVVCIAASTDGRIASGSDDSTLRLWDLASGNPIVTLQGHSAGIKCVAFSPNGQLIASGSHDKSILVWDAKTGDITFGPFTMHTNSIAFVRFTCDSQRIVSSCSQGTVLVWDAKVGLVVAGPLQVGREYQRALAISYDGRQITSSESGSTILLWDSETGFSTELPTSNNYFNNISFSPDNRHIAATGSWVVQVWNLQNNEIVAESEMGSSLIFCLAFSSDSQRIVSGDADGCVCIWDICTGSIVGPVQVHRGFVLSVTFSPDDQQIISASQDRTICIWKPCHEISEQRDHLRSIAFSHDGDQILSCSSGSLCRRDTTTGHVIAQQNFDESDCSAATLSPDGQQVWSCTSSGEVRVWDVATGEMVHQSDLEAEGAAFLSPDCQRVVFVSLREAIVLNMLTGKQVLRRPLEKYIHTAAFSPNGLKVILGPSDGMMEMWDVETGEPVMEAFGQHGAWVRSIAFSRDGQRIVSGADSNVFIYDLSTGKCVGSSCRGLDDLIVSVNFSPNGKQVISGDNGSIRVWNTTAIEGILPMVAIFEGNLGDIRSVTFSPDGKQIASGYGDGTIRLWNVERGIASLQSHEAGDDNNFHGKPVNGWVRGRNFELLYWVPPDNRVGLWDDATVWIMGRRQTKLDFSQFVHGTSWASSYTPPKET